MKRLSQTTLLTLMFGMLSACTNILHQAPVEDRKPGREPRGTPASSSADDTKDERGFHTVRKGDTLLRIALDYGQNYRDLVTWNNLANPNDIKVDQVLRVAPPDGASSVQTMPVTAAPEIKPVQPPVPRKTSPRGDKKPYSEAALAEARGDTGSKADGKDDKPDPVPAKPTPSASIAAGSTVSATDDDKLTWMWPSDGRILGTFDEGKNKGIDIGGKAGQHVMAASSGKVMYAGSGIRGYGNLVIVKHSNNLLSAYAHNRSIIVKEGQNVNKGQVIAEMGDSDADAVKLHFEIRQQGKPVDPSRFLPSR